MATIKRAGPEILINTTGGFHQQPTVTGKGGPVSESILVAWSNSTDNHIRGQRLEAVGGLKEGAEFLMATSTTNIIRHPAIDGLPFPGGYIAVWLDETAHQVKGQRYAGDGSKVGDEVIVGNADGEEGALQPAILSLSGVGVVMTNSNDFAVAWTGQKVGSSAFPPGPGCRYSGQVQQA